MTVLKWLKGLSWTLLVLVTFGLFSLMTDGEADNATLIGFMLITANCILALIIAERYKNLVGTGFISESASKE
ncbi:MAG: hypothetical protein WC052_05170 [Patescibacteria group bacterium]